MSAKVVLECLLVFGTVLNQPIRAWVADAVAENDVQPKPNFVDEVVHIAFKATVVVAREDDPPSSVQNNPAGEVNRRDAGKPAAIEHMPGGVVNCLQDGGDGQTTKQTWLEAAHGAELVGDLVIFEYGE